MTGWTFYELQNTRGVLRAPWRILGEKMADLVGYKGWAFSGRVKSTDTLQTVQEWRPSLSYWCSPRPALRILFGSPATVPRELNVNQVSRKVPLKMLRCLLPAIVEQNVRPEFAMNRANIMMHQTTRTTTTTKPTTSTTNAAVVPTVERMLEGKRREIWLPHWDHSRNKNGHFYVSYSRLINYFYKPTKDYNIVHSDSVFSSPQYHKPFTCSNKVSLLFDFNSKLVLYSREKNFVTETWASYVDTYRQLNLDKGCQAYPLWLCLLFVAIKYNDTFILSSGWGMF